jgi:protein-tyrosine phosphatase
MEKKQLNNSALEIYNQNGQKIDYDLNTINGIDSNNDRIRNLLFGISHITGKKKCELCHKMVEKHTYKFHYFTHPSKIFDWLYLGTFKNASNFQEMRIFKIKYILNCAYEINIDNLPKSIHYCHLKLTDNETTDIVQYFDQAFDFIEEARKKKENILIHCQLGISRSSTILIGYLIKYMGYTTETALEFLKSKRSSVHPNSGFREQLLSYEQTIKKNQRRIIKGNSSNIAYSDYARPINF